MELKGDRLCQGETVAPVPASTKLRPVVGQDEARLTLERRGNRMFRYRGLAAISAWHSPQVAMN